MFIILLAAQALVNLIGALGPEVGFDALWYHLTIPKLYLLAGKIYHVPGGLLYYSEMPRLTEILFIPLMKYLGDIGPHLLNWGAGIGIIIIIYKLSRRFGLSSTFAYLAALIFYATPLVGWQSGSGYVDLFRTFFEVLALYFAISQKSLLAGLVAGLAVSTKSLALGSILPLLLIVPNRRLFLGISFLTFLPWFLSAYLNTGYPLYPIGTGILDVSHSINLNFGDFWKLWISPADPISPIYLIALPFLWQIIKNKKFTGLLVYCVTGLILWFLTPHTGGGRFILPYLPAWSILIAAVASKNKIIYFAVIIISLINLGYRAVATSRLAPYLLNRETKTQYLCRHLDLKVTYVNCDNFVPQGLTLVRGYHNLYYLDFPFVHESWYRGEKYNYVLSP